MGAISGLKENIPQNQSGPGRFLSAEERADKIRLGTPFFIKDIFEGVSSYKDKQTGNLQKQWIYLCIDAAGGEDWKISLTQTPYRNAMVTGLRELLGQDEYALKGVGPVKLVSNPTKNGRGFYDIEDYEEPAPPVATAKAATGTSKCPTCKQTVSGPLQVMGDEKFVAHKCPKDGKASLLLVA